MALYAYSLAPQTVTDGTVLGFTGTIKRGRSASLSDDGVVLKCRNSLYQVHVNAVGTTTAAGGFELSAYADGIAVPGARSIQDVAVGGDSEAVAFTFLVSTGCEPVTVTVRNTGDDGTVESVALTVARLT